jgi:hypothetical protein
MGFVVAFFLFASFSFFVDCVEKRPARFCSHGLPKGGYGSRMSGTLNTCCMAPSGGLGRDCFAWASGTPPSAGWTDLGNLGAVVRRRAAANEPQLWTPDCPGCAARQLSDLEEKGNGNMSHICRD